LKSIGVQVLCCVFKGYHAENPLPSRVVENLMLDGLLTNERPLTSPEGRSALRLYPSRMRLTEKGVREYLSWLRIRKNAFSSDLKKLEKMTSWKH
jgi:hypothetical protein